MLVYMYVYMRIKHLLEMKYKITTFLLLGITIILCLVYFKQRQEISELNAQSKVVGGTDTVYVTKPYKPVKAYNTQLLPKYVFLYGQNWKNSEDSSNNDSIQKGDSLVQALFDKDKLNLSFYRPSVNGFLTKEYKLDLDKYKYNWVNGNLTQEEVGFKLKVEPYAYLKYRYFNKLADMGIGISFKTRRIQYKLGINEFYYPNLQNKPGTDLEISITYN